MSLYQQGQSPIDSNRRDATSYEVRCKQCKALRPLTTSPFPISCAETCPQPASSRALVLAGLLLEQVSVVSIIFTRSALWETSKSQQSWFESFIRKCSETFVAYKHHCNTITNTLLVNTSSMGFKAVRLPFAALPALVSTTTAPGE